MLARAGGGSSGSSSNTPEAANYTLEITYPKAINTAPNGLDSGNRCYKAYTGLTYEIPLCAIGGSYPYTWSLSNAPAGMSVTAYTMASGFTGHKLVWTNPQASATDVQITVTDALDNTDSETYSITVGTSGFYFVDPVSGSDAAAGTLAAPWQTLNKVDDTTAATDIVYFRTGTVTLSGIAITANSGDVNGEARTDWAGSEQWIAYPGESPEFDFEYTGSGAPYGDASDKQRIRFNNANIFIDGFIIDRPMVMAFQINNASQRGCVFWRNTMQNIHNGVNGGNSAYVMWTRQTDTPRYGICMVSNSLDVTPPVGTYQCGYKFYDCLKPLIEGNDAPSTNSGECIALKGGVSMFTVRANRSTDVTGLWIGGNMANDDGTGPIVSEGEICYNLGLSDATSTSFGVGNLQVMDHSDNCGEMWIYRNTFRGVVSISDMKTGDGPIHWFKNVLVNANGAQTPFAYFIDSNVTDQTVVDIANNLTGASGDGIIDSSGLLTGTSRTNYLGTRGHEIP